MRLPRERRAELEARRHTRRELHQALVRGLRGARMPVAPGRDSPEPRRHVVCAAADAEEHLAAADVIGVQEAFGACVDCLWSRASGEACTEEELLAHAYEAAAESEDPRGDASVLLVLAQDSRDSARVRALVQRYLQSARDGGRSGADDGR